MSHEIAALTVPDLGPGGNIIPKIPCAHNILKFGKCDKRSDATIAEIFAIATFLSANRNSLDSVLAKGWRWIYFEMPPDKQDIPPTLPYCPEHAEFTDSHKRMLKVIATVDEKINRESQAARNN